MESLTKHSLLKFNENTLIEVRKQYDLDKPGSMDQAIDILDQWIKKQNHFVRKDYPRDYLERVIINSKGSIERAKVKVDKLMTYRTLLPQYFPKNYSKNNFSNLNVLCDALVPVPTDDYYRILMIKHPPKLTSQNVSDYFKYASLVWEYIESFDYGSGLEVVIDYVGVNILDLMKIMNVIEMRQVAVLVTDGFSLRIKGIHIITPSKGIETLVTLLKQILSEKLGSRIHVHTKLDTLYNYIPKTKLPLEYDGDLCSIYEMHENLISAIFSEEYKTYASDLHQACTDESLRRDDKFNEQYMGTPGSFRSLHVD